MNKSLMRFVLVFGVLLTGVHADAKQEYQWQSATVVSVANHETPSNYAGDSPTDAPLQAEVHSYDIGIRLNCTVYGVRYDSELDYLPAVFAPDHSIEINLQKHVMEVALPGDREVKLGIASRNRAKEALCPANK